MKYTGDCLLTRMVWSGNGYEHHEDNYTSSWMKIRKAIMIHRYSHFDCDDNKKIEHLAWEMLRDKFPILGISHQNCFYTQGDGDWDKFICSWAKVEQELYDEYVSIDDWMDCLTEDFESLKCAIDAARSLSHLLYAA